MTKIIQGRAILLEGPSGRGKTFSYRNLNQKNTLLINVERKALSFKGGSNFPQLKPKTIKEIFDCLDQYSTNPNVEQLVMDSFSAFSDLLVNESRILKTGWDVWSYYNQKIYDFFAKLKKFADNGKHVIILGHDEVINDEDGAGIRRLKTKGNEWQGVTEKEFDIVLWADAKVEEEGKVNYQFVTQTNGKTPAKSPVDMLPIRMPNDLQLVLDAIKKYDV